MESKFDICIVGAGMAGATIAAYLAPKGIRIALIDTSFKEKKRIVGELLQPGAVLALEKMGLEHLLLGLEAQTINGYALLQKEETMTIPYPANFKGIALNNGLFLQQIRAAALSNQSVTAIHGKALELLENEQQEVIGVRYRESQTSQLKLIHAPLTIVSDGFFSSFRKHLSQNKKTITSSFIGLSLKNCAIPFPNYGHVFLSSPTPFICYPTSNQEVRVLIDYPSDTVPKKSVLHAYLQSHVTPFIPAGMLNSYEQVLQEGHFKVMPNHYMPAKPLIRKGAVMLGDALNMRHPLTGGGLTAVFSDIYILSQHLLAMPDFNDLDLIEKKTHAYYVERQHANANLNILANALYAVMSHDALKITVFKYLQRNTKHSEEPIAILAGLNRKHHILIKHFVAVAWFGAYTLLRESILNLPQSIKILSNALTIIRPLVKNELSFLSTLLHK